jgi:hypothetical protein
MSAPKPSPISRALRRAMALLEGVLTDNCQPCRNLVVGSTPRELRAEFNEYHALLEKIEPKRKTEGEG